MRALRLMLGCTFLILYFFSLAKLLKKILYKCELYEMICIFVLNLRMLLCQGMKGINLNIPLLW